MRGKSAILGMPLVGLVTCGTVHAAPRQPACVEIMAVCEQAGFVRGDAKAGDGLFVDCVVPILRGTPQRRRASLHFSHQLGASGLRISESRCAAATLAIEGRSPDADRV